GSHPFCENVEEGPALDGGAIQGLGVISDRRGRPLPAWDGSARLATGGTGVSFKHMDPALVRAVREHRVVVFVYDGLLRTVEPHVYGITTAGYEALSGYQTAGFSHSSAHPGWRMFRGDAMNDLAVTPYRFAHTRPGFNPNDRIFAEVFSRARSP
ncbi:MAG TPA: hypothetical protein VEY30_10180, partial [Myxococcaceae bacterium]|nr:hypothetical protein [Myxococcaceae bacterium]